jgi:5'-nucleotidase
VGRVVRGMAAAVFVCLVGGCSGNEGADETTSTAPTEETTTTTEADETLRVLVSNDDGIESEGIDVLVEALMGLDQIEVTVVAPAGDRSGSSDKVTPLGASFEEGETLSGVTGTAVDGFPADSIAVALDELDLEPHLVVSGINEGQNIGPVASISGTVGVARTALRRGIPAIAASAAMEFDEDEFAVAADLVTRWITQNRDALLAGTFPSDSAVSVNIPDCDPEEMGEAIEVPLAESFPEGVNPFESSCDLANSEPKDDYEALSTGFPTITRVPAEL